MILKSINSFNSILGVGSRKTRKPLFSAIEERQAKYPSGNRDRHLTEGTHGEGCATKVVCTKSK